MLRIIGSYDAHNPMAVEDVIARYPTLSATHPHESRSARFAHISTADTLRQLDSEGFKIHGVQIQRTKKNSTHAGYEKHELRLRKDGFALSKIGDVIPEVVLRNAHNGTSRFEMLLAMLRLWCLNGATVGTTWGNVGVAHVGKDTGKKVIDASYTVLGSVGRLTDSIEAWRAIELTSDDRHAFAEQAFALRYHVDAETGTTRAPVTPYALLNVRREHDVPDDLWTVYQRVQENLVRGGQQGISGQRRASTRALTGIDQTLKINRQLFDLTESWAASKASPDVPRLAAFAG